MAKRTQNVEMLASVIGEDLQDWMAGDVRKASEDFANYLVQRKAAVITAAAEKRVPAVSKFGGK